MLHARIPVRHPQMYLAIGARVSAAGQARREPPEAIGRSPFESKPATVHGPGMTGPTLDAPYQPSRRVTGHTGHGELRFSRYGVLIRGAPESESPAALR